MKCFPTLTDKVWVSLFLFFAFTGFPHVSASAENRLRTEMDRIHLPTWCANVNDRGLSDEENMCASALEALQREIENNTAISEQCTDLPDLSRAAAGANLDGKVGFLPLGHGHFLIKVMCGEGAYNVRWLVFAYNMTAQKSAPEGNQSAPLLLLFPDNSIKNGPPKFTQASFMRAFDERKAILYDFRAMLGDGSGGFYAEYQIDRKTFIPTLKTSIYKEEADHQNGYHFRIGKRPHGGDWKILTVGPINRGCLVDSLGVTDATTCQVDQR